MASPAHTVPKSELEVLNQLISDEIGLYRIRARNRVHYLKIEADVFAEETMCRPYLLIPELPEFPDDDWTQMDICRSSGSLKWSLSYEPLPEVTSIWHPKKVDVLSLKILDRIRSGVHEVLYDDNGNGHQGNTAIAKIACFRWQIRSVNIETWVYSQLHEAAGRGSESGGSTDINAGCSTHQLFPTFLAHLTENGRVIGMLLERVEGEFASIEDLPACEDVVRRFHHLSNLIHGDVNRHNFLVDREKDTVRVIDFEHCEPYEESQARQELESLPAELSETTGRGGVIVKVLEEEEI
ncbi:hypothetical protein PRK78_004435 [Emydomyces testavorans]|uniref:Protein kinase domain-containing protein n=1 Tax=Emydomyces testavorans TaxID=2070801 RepID=A0AAF0DI36_9EURO|nr:hypothetical protein PRK78_004435 [Emydomyces testavorans]